MAVPTLFGSQGAQTFTAKRDPEGGNITSPITTYTVSSGTTGGTVGLMRFQEGFNLIGIRLKSADLDTGTSATLNVGYAYDDTSAAGADDNNAFFNALDIMQDAGSRNWPIDDGLSNGGFVAAGDGYITITFGGGATTVEGDITFQAEGFYE